MKNKIIILFALVLTLTMTQCRMIEDQKPQQSITPEVALGSPSAARAAILGAYSTVQSANYYGLRYLLFPDMHGAGTANMNLRHSGTFPSFAQIANRAILTDNVEVSNMWSVIYSGINDANQIIDKVSKINDPAFTDKGNILAEAYFLRAFHYFNLVRYWGGVPLVLTPTDKAEVGALQVPRATVAEVYTQILADLNFALGVNTSLNASLGTTITLPTTYGTTAARKGRATISAANALKARVHLYRSSSGLAVEWNDAIAAAQAASSGFSLVGTFSDLFVARNTSESIWEIQFDNVDQNSIAFFLLPGANGGRNEMRPTSQLQGIYATGDTRRINTASVAGGTATTTTSTAGLKYFRVTTGDDYVIVFRLAEMILTRAEALVERNTGTDLTDAVTLINQIRTRAGLAAYAGLVDQASLRTEVFNQRRAELALEGHFFFDLVRTNRAAAYFGATWNANQALFPIPLREINANPKLVQNPGY
ncbi:MAG: RagB/SusD family nutrient uptake outer membrane protein [Cytophagales bacterium]|nr:MAG: RagB/SusD family nutrient uptake outer membrane protein [Cytophagales bacterium]